MNMVLEFVLSNVPVSGALALLVFLITRFWLNPHLARALWLLVLIKLVTPPLIEIPIPLLHEDRETNVAPSMLANSSEEEVARVAADPNARVDQFQVTSVPPAVREPLWPSWLLAIWAVGLLFLSLLAFRRHRRLSGILRRARAADPQIQEDAAHLAARLGVTKRPAICVTDERAGPFVTVWWRKQVIVLPTFLIAEMSIEERQTVLAHELAHVRRGDRWIRLCELFVLGLYWWNPIAWLASRRLRQSMEECCDAVVIWAMPESRKSYGRALLRTVEFLTESEPLRPLAGNAFGPPHFKLKR
jgi:bla regulator protein BlaR1